jgi:hypothetical protein
MKSHEYETPNNMASLTAQKMINNIYPSDFGLHIKDKASNELNTYQKKTLDYLIEMKETFKKNGWDESKEALTKTVGLTDKEKEAKDYRDSENIKFLHYIEQLQRYHEGKGPRVPPPPRPVNHEVTRSTHKIGPKGSNESPLIQKRMDDIEINLITKLLDCEKYDRPLSPQLQEYADYLASGRNKDMMPAFITTEARTIIPRELINHHNLSNIENEVSEAEREVIIEWLDKIDIHMNLTAELANLNERLTALKRGGKRRRTNKRKSNKNKKSYNNKSSNKRSSNKRKSNKRKSNKLSI